MSLFSIVTVNLNNLSGLVKTKKSLENQTFMDFEWIVIDGFSTDGSVEILKKCQGVNWISEKDKGLYDAMNKGIEKSSGRYLIFMNSGDHFASSDVLEKIASGIFKYKNSFGVMPDFIYGDSLEDDGKENKNPVPYRKARNARWIWYGMFTRHQSMVFSRSSLNGIRYNTKRQIAADYEFMVRYLIQKVSTLYLDFPISTFEPGGLSYLRWPVALHEANDIRKKFLKLNTILRWFIFLIQGVIAYLKVNHSSSYNKFRYKERRASDASKKTI